MFLIYFLHYSDHCIQRHCHDTKQYDGHQKPIHLKHLAGVDDQIAEPFPGGQKFSDDNTYKAETNVDFHGTDDCRNGRRQYHFCEDMNRGAVKGIDQFDFVFIGADKTGVERHNTAKDRHRHSGYNDGCAVGAKPNNEQRRQCGFWETVQNNKVRLQHH